MKTQKFLNILIAFLMISTSFISINNTVLAMPSNPTDETKVPHYFGPYSNWANSPYTLPDAKINILGNGNGATASATVGANGTITAINVTSPGAGYTNASVEILGAGNGASATALVTTSGIVNGITVTSPGSGYLKPVVSFSGGGGTGTLVQTGNPLMDRQYATDFAAPMVVPASVSAMASRIYDVAIGSATGGTFKLNVGGIITTPIAFNALAAEVEAALVLSLGVGSATVTGSGSIADPWMIKFSVAPTSASIDGAGLIQPVIDSSAVYLSPIATVHIGSASGGTFTLGIDAATTAAIAFNAAALDVQNAIDLALGIPNSVTVSGTGTSIDPWLISFVTPPVAVTMNSALLTKGVTDASAVLMPTDRFSANIGSGIGGTFTLSVDTFTTSAIAYNAAALDVENALIAALGPASAVVSGIGTVASPYVITFAAAPANVSIDGALLVQPTLVPTLVILPTALPVGTLSSFDIWNQATTGGSPAPSAGNQFHAYVLRSTGVGKYLVVYDSGLLTVPALTVAGVSEKVSFAVPNIPLLAGDVLAFYGAGIPVDDLGTGVDTLSYPVTSAPVQGSSFTLNSPGFPVLSQTRTYSFGAAVIDTSAVVPLVNATGTAYGGVSAVNLINGGSGYTNPTVDFDLPDGANGVQASGHAVYDQLSGAITAVVVDNPGSGYSFAPGVVIRDGTLFDPILNGGSGALASATLSISAITVDTFGSGYVTAPTVTISESDPLGLGNGALASATVSAGGVTSVTLVNGGTGYNTTGGIKKFQDGLPVLCDPTAGWANCTNNNLGQHIPIAVPDQTTFSIANGFTADTDYYVIAVVQHRERMSSSLPVSGTLLREYVQLETPANASFSKHIALKTDLLDGTSVPTLMPDGTQAYAVDDPHYLGPVIVAQKDRAVRIVFYNLLPAGAEGDLFLPVDSTIMGSGMGPMDMMTPMNNGTVMDEVRNPICNQYPKPDGCYADNRATLHLHGGNTPWISDGTPHQWITPANETTPWPQGVSVSAVPDMTGVPGVPNCSAENDGCMTFYYTNQQSARLLFYHDHSWGITRLNVYAGEAAGYVITDATEKKLVSSGIIPSNQIPLIIQDRTFVPQTAQLAASDPTWDSTRWGTYGNLWYHHVYMPAQNPGDASGMSAYGRWMYGPWFWPPATNAVYGPIDNPYYNPSCNIDDPATWQYQTDPFCEPKQIPGTPNISAGMEQFNDTPVVNGTAYPTTTVQPKAYRFRMLNAANDRFWNLQWYVADPRTGTNSEVALNPLDLEAAQTDPTVSPRTITTVLNPVTGKYENLNGPDWIQIGTEGGFLPAPVVVDGQQNTTWITDPTRFDFGNVDKHSLLLAPAERADVIVDFSQFAGKTLILYNDAPAAFPARIPSYDYYLGAPDMSPVGSPTILPGYGPNTRTVMQVVVAAATPAPAYNLSALQAAFKHHADGSGVFESGQNPIIVGQAGYNTAYGTNFATSNWCNAPGSTSTRCDGFARINEQGGDLFGFNTLKSPNTKLSIALQPKALHDEMNASSFDEYGRMTANIGVEAVPATPGAQNVTLYPYVNPSTEIIDATNLPKSDIKVTPISTASDGTQIWKITHNGVDTHPIHWHLYDVQLLNRVTWDNIIIPPDATELGWKDTLRVSPLEDTIVALRPIMPVVPFEVPNSIRPLNPSMPIGSSVGFNNIDANGNPTVPIVNQLVNFGWEYVYHCHILSHEEMDMMRPVSVAVPPNAPTVTGWTTAGKGNNTTLTLTWNDNSINETAFVVQSKIGANAWTDLVTIPSPLNLVNTHGAMSYTDTTFRWNTDVYSYRVVALNQVGYGGDYMSTTVQSVSNTVGPILAPTGLVAALQAGTNGPQVRLTWTDNATNEAGFNIERSTNGVNFVNIGTAPARNNTGSTSYVDVTVPTGVTVYYRVNAFNAAGVTSYSNVASLIVPVAPIAPGSFTAVNGPNGNGGSRTVILSWVDLSGGVATGFTVQRATNAAFTSNLSSVTVAAGTLTLTQTGLARNTNYYYRIRANNGLIVSSAWVNANAFPIRTNP